MYHIYTDGACTLNKNDNKYSKGKGGHAIIIIKDNEICFQYAGGRKETTNNYEELYAIYLATKQILNLDGTDYTIYSDSAYCINIFTKWIESWRNNGWRRSRNQTIQNIDIIKKIYYNIFTIKTQEKNVNFCKVKGHSSDYYNNLADKLAVEAKENVK